MEGCTRVRGRRGEWIAEEYLETEGYQIRAKNYRYGRFEIDIIAEIADVLIFTEVKLRESTQFGYPEEFVSEAQAERIRQAAEHYLENFSWKGSIRFDIIAIEKRDSHRFVSHFKDAF